MSRFKGVTKEIALNPKEYPNLDPKAVFFPHHVLLRNGRVDDGGNWKKRPGYEESHDTGSNYGINHMIDESTGYVIDTEGVIYKLSGSLATAVQLQDVLVEGGARPQHEHHNDFIIIVAGGRPVKIDNDITSLLLGSPPSGAKHIARVSTYTLLAGYDPTEFRWCTAGNPEDWPAGYIANIQKTGETIKNMVARSEYIYFFKEKSIEVWYHVGSTAITFGRRDEMWVDGGVGDAGDSVVVANDNLYWLDALDRSFNMLKDRTSDRTPKVISRSHRSDIEALTVTSDVIGFDCRKDNCIRWLAPTNGKCFKYDYLHDTFSTENLWSGGWDRMPIDSYMEINGTAYFGDKEPTGKVYELDSDIQDDGGNAMRLARQFTIQSESGNNSRFHRLGFRVKRGVGSVGDSPVFSFRHRFNGGAWHPYQDISLGIEGDDDPWKFLYALGMGREIEMEIVYAASFDFLLTNMKLTMEELRF